MTLFRRATPADRPFVVSAWASSYKHSHSAGIISSEDWAPIMHAQLSKLMARPSTTTIVAYDLPSSLYGFICGDVSRTMPVVHYVYVKDPYRSEEEPGGTRSGPRHARGLFAALGVDPDAPFLYTCKTFAAVRLADKIPRARFTPAAARYDNYLEERR